MEYIRGMEFNISGIIDEFGCPVLDCAVCNNSTMKKVSVKALIDTGAFNFHVKQSVIDLLKLPQLSLQEGNYAMEGKLTKLSYEGSLEIEDIIFPKIMILPLDESFNYDFLIGVQFLIGFVFNYEGQRRKWSIYV